MENESVEQPIEIPLDRLPPEILTRIIEEFILREGTDYGESEVALDVKTEQIKRQLEKGIVRVYFDAESESVTLVRV